MSELFRCYASGGPTLCLIMCLASLLLKSSAAESGEMGGKHYKASPAVGCVALCLQVPLMWTKASMEI